MQKCRTFLRWCKDRQQFLSLTASILLLIITALAIFLYAGSPVDVVDESDPSKHSTQHNRVLAFILLLLPPAVQISILFFLRKSKIAGLFALIMGFSSLSYQLAWMAYSLGSFRQIMWIVCTGIATLLVGVASLVSWLLVRTQGSERRIGEAAPDPLEEFRAETSKHLFSVICFFLSLFLCVTYLLSFSFGFHDKNQIRHAQLGLCAVPPPSKAESVTINPVSAKPALILFNSGSAEVEAESEPKVGTDSEKLMKIYNARAIESVIAAIGSAAQEDQRYRQYRLTFAGHTDEQDVTERNRKYKSNYELSEARALGVYLYLSKLIKSKVVHERVILTTASENNYIGTKPTSKDHWRSVEVMVEDVGNFNSATCDNQLDLNDYIYFTTYTITTTGYGDIRPVTSTAKFITSIANFFELFFLVIVFNVLIASKRTTVEGEHTGAHVN